jgi:predicted dehydrogenase
MSLHSFRPTRRSFLKGLTATTAGGVVFPNLLIAQDPATPASRKLGIAAIGCGGKGASDLEGASRENEVVALCDVDTDRLAVAAKKFPNAKTFTDFRQMLDEVKSIEAVTVSTPDHAHYPAAMHAIALGKHVCVQKPLVNTLWEGRQLHLAAKKKGVITQMGNQGHTYDDNRVVKEWIAAGVIGKVNEVHVWTNRPIWPQGRNVQPRAIDVPANLDWEHWLAQAPDSPFYEVAPDEAAGKRGKTIAPFNWRGWIEYGAGAFGDMGCHLIDAASWALDLGVPRFVTATQVDDITDIAWPTGSIVKMEFPKVKGHGDVTMHWYEGKRPDGTPYVPELPAIIDRAEAFKTGDPKKEGKMPSGGWFIVGSEGVIFNPGDQAKNPQLWPLGLREKGAAVPKTLERSPKAGAPQEEWTLAIKNGKPFPFMSQFDYSVPLTELTLVGGVAMRVAGQRLEWDSEKLAFAGNSPANKFIKRPVYRKGWDYSAAKI